MYSVFISIWDHSIYLSIYIFGCAKQFAESEFPSQGLNLQWKCKVLTPILLENSSYSGYLIFVFIWRLLITSQAL